MVWRWGNSFSLGVWLLICKLGRSRSFNPNKSIRGHSLSSFKAKWQFKMLVLWLIHPTDLYRVEKSSLDERGHLLYAGRHLIILILQIFTEYLPLNSCWVYSEEQGRYTPHLVQFTSVEMTVLLNTVVEPGMSPHVLFQNLPFDTRSCMLVKNLTLLVGGLGSNTSFVTSLLHDLNQVTSPFCPAISLSLKLG